MKFKDGNFYTVDQISPRRNKTPEGFLLCEGVPISRVGEFEYSALEAGIPGNGGKALLSRTEEELFSDDTMRSFEGKPVVIGHSRFADPKNWKQVSVGHVQNVRRGEGEQSNLLLADLLLQDEEGIRLVEDGELKEVSCGYDAKSVDDGDGRGHQVGIVGNHVALVSKARCGTVCSIGDGFMAMKAKSLLRRLFKDGDEEKFNEVLDNVDVKEVEDGESERPEPTDAERIKSLEGQLAEIKAQLATLVEAQKQGDEEDDEKGDEDDSDNDQQTDSDDEEVTEEEVKEVISDAEDICPGLKKPVGDSANGKFTRGALNRIKRQAITGSDVKIFGDAAELDGQALDMAFKGTVELVRSARNPKAKPFGDSKMPVNSIDAINARNKAFWEGK